MSHDIQDRSEELLQDLGLKTYEARSFTVLCRIPQGTAKDISELTDVPRTRVYDAMESLEGRGLVEVQHGSPQRFRAIPIEEAVGALRRQYESRISNLHQTLLDLEPVSRPTEDVQQVWVLTGRDNIQIRMVDLIDRADGEVVLIVEEQVILKPSLIQSLEAATNRGVGTSIWTSPSVDRSTVEATIDDVNLIGEGLEHLQPNLDEPSDSLAGLLLADREAVVLVYNADHGRETENAILARGPDNGLVSLTRRILSKHLGQGP